MEKVTVKKITDREIMLDACESTFAGKSNQSLLSMYKSEHSPARTQMFWVKCENIPLYVSTHLLRHHVGSQPFALTHRVDRNGGGLDLPTIVNEIKDLLGERENWNQISEEYKNLTVEIECKLTLIEEKGGRNTPTNLSLMINAQSLIDMAKLRLCNTASPHTRKVFGMIKEGVQIVDPALASMMVRKCIYRNGLCGDRPCGFMKTSKFREELGDYLINFSGNQIYDFINSEESK